MNPMSSQSSISGSNKDDWKSDNFRQKVMTQMKDAFEKAGVPTNRQHCEDMEQQVFSKATKRDEYMALVARLILHVTNTANKRNQAQGIPQPDPSTLSALGYMSSARSQPSGMMNRQSSSFGVSQAAQPGMVSSQYLSQLNVSQPQMTSIQQPLQSHVTPQVPPQLPAVQSSASSVSGTSGMRAHTPSPASQPAVACSPAPSLHAAAPSPAQLIVASPSPQLIPPSPAPHPGGAAGVPSPSLGPASVGPAHSPAAPISAAEEQIYWEKHRQLSKYIEPLRRMMNRMSQDESKDVNLPIGLKMSKLKSLMDMLTSTKRKVSLRTLEKCEIALQKLDEKPSAQPSTTSSNSSANPTLRPTTTTATATTTTVPLQPIHYQDNNLCQPLLEAVKRQSQNPVIAHTLHRSFTPALMAFDAPAIQVPLPPAKRFCPDMSKRRSTLPHALQGELARLGERFKVLPSLLQEKLISTTVLTCSYIDGDLPPVPPITIKVPKNYPFASPEYKASNYDSTPFLQNIEKKLSCRLMHCSNIFSVTALLDAWECSIRQAVNMDEN